MSAENERDLNLRWFERIMSPNAIHTRALSPCCTCPCCAVFCQAHRRRRQCRCYFFLGCCWVVVMPQQPRKVPQTRPAVRQTPHLWHLYRAHVRDSLVQNAELDGAFGRLFRPLIAPYLAPQVPPWHAAASWSHRRRQSREGRWGGRGKHGYQPARVVVVVGMYRIPPKHKSTKGQPATRNAVEARWWSSTALPVPPQGVKAT